MQKFLTDVHTHSSYSYDGREELNKMLEGAYQKGLAFYGVSEHFDYDVFLVTGKRSVDEEEYFHGARHLQEDYAGCMNVLIGGEFGYTEDTKAHTMYLSTYEKYHPDFVVNSVHGVHGDDYYYKKLFAGREKQEVYDEYLALVRNSLDAPYPYDIVGHFGYLARYAPYADRRLLLSEFGEKIDDILRTIIQKDKILEVNSSNKGLEELTIPSYEILQRYHQLGGRKVSFASDAHDVERIADKREEVMNILKEIGFTHVVVPCKGEHIALEI